MLTLTDNASSLINTITHHQAAPEANGLRISAEPDEQGLAVATAPAPLPGDQVVEQQGAVVFLDATAAAVLDDEVLDASINEAGGIEFAVGGS